MERQRGPQENSADNLIQKLIDEREQDKVNHAEKLASETGAKGLINRIRNAFHPKQETTPVKLGK